MSKKIVIIGNTSNAKLAHYYFENDSEYDVVAFSVNEEFITDKVFCGLPVVDFGSIEESYPSLEFDVFVAVGYSNMNKIREKMYELAKEKGYNLPNYISSRCSFLSKELIGDNNLILEDNTIQPFVKIGSNNVFWSGNHIGHDAIVKNNCFLTSHVVVSGFTVLDNNCFLGVNSTIRDAITIGEFSLIGAGATIMKSTEPYSVYLANKPFKMDKKSTDLNIS
jgi:sugar O-acyltransferase (sialic acid O-acetyltransferase NeuD family)